MQSLRGKEKNLKSFREAVEATRVTLANEFEEYNLEDDLFDQHDTDKPLSLVEVMVAVMRQTTSGTARNRFEDALDQLLEKKNVTKPFELLDRKDVTSQRLKYFHKYFLQPEAAAANQRRYLTSNLKKGSRAITMRLFAERLDEISQLLPYFPQQQVEGKFVSPMALTEAGKRDILVDVAPAKWRSSASHANIRLHEASLEEVLNYFEVLEVNEQSERLAQEREKRKENKSSGAKSESSGRFEKVARTTKTNEKTASENSRGSSTTECALCKLVKGNYKSHRTEDCNRKSTFVAAMDLRAKALRGADRSKFKHSNDRSEKGRVRYAKEQLRAACQSRRRKRSHGDKKKSRRKKGRRGGYQSDSSSASASSSSSAVSESS